MTLQDVELRRGIAVQLQQVLGPGFEAEYSPNSSLVDDDDDARGSHGNTIGVSFDFGTDDEFSGDVRGDYVGELAAWLTAKSHFFLTAAVRLHAYKAEAKA